MRILIFTIVLMSGAISLAAQSDSSGEKLFRDYCKACHSIDQKLVGPALKDIHLRRDSAWIVSFIKGSQSMIQSGDSIGMSLFMEFNQIPMPDQNLNDDEIGLVLDYIKVESQPKVVDANPIDRPHKDWGNAPTMLQFDNYLFWIPFTLAVVFLIYMLYYMTVIYDFSKTRRS